MPAPYPYMNGTKIGSDLGQLLVYGNSITDNMLGLYLMLSFFLIVFLASAISSFRFTGRIKLEVHFAAASFATFGFTVILSTVKDFLSPVYTLVSLGLVILGVVWILLSNPTEGY
jgi:hypothetical protein